MADPYTHRGPVIVIHLEDPPGSGLEACSGAELAAVTAPEWRDVPRVPCRLCLHTCNREVPDGYTVIRSDELRRLHAWQALVADLDRNSNGRHEGDVDGGDPTGISQGNTHLAAGMRIGWTIDGRPIVVPDKALRYDPAAWIP